MDKKTYIISVLVFLLIVYSIQNIFIPANNSYQFACGELDLNESGIVIQGTTSTNNEGDIQVELFTTDKKVLKHEYCHVDQILEERIAKYCGPKYYFNEVECYLSENFPDKIYEVFYDLPN